MDGFSGEGGIAFSARNAGVASREFELSRSESGDLTRPAVLRRLRQAAAQGKIIACSFAPPCSSFSCARNRTQPIRSKLFPRGFPHIELSDKDKKRVLIGNKCLDSTISLIRSCNRWKIPFVLENPQSSYMWSDVALQKVLSESHANFVTITMCAFGKPWRKATTLAFGNVEDCDMFKFGFPTKVACKGRHGFCSFTEKKHIQLTFPAKGKKSFNGVHCMTRYAQEYPAELCYEIARVLTSRCLSCHR